MTDASPPSTTVPAVLEEGARRGRPYVEFLRVPALSAGLLRIPKGGVDRQSPHQEDELYHVIGGRGRFEANGVDRAVGPGDLLFVGARVPHHFHSVEEELVVLAVFGPAESEG